MNALNLAATTFLAPAIAVDIAAFAGYSCLGDAYIQCTNLPSNMCCNVIAGQGPGSYGATSGLWTGLPDPSVIVGGAQDRDGNSCGSVISMHTINGGDVCLNFDQSMGQYAGFSYTVGSSESKGVIYPDQVACTASVEPDTLVLSNGTGYDLTKMQPEQKEKVWDLLSNSNVADSMPNTFSEFKKDFGASPLPNINEVLHVSV